MAKHEKITDDELLAAIREEVAAADFAGTNELSFQREQSTRAYNGVDLTDGLQPTTGMSSIVNNKIQPAIESLTNYLTKVFCSDMDTVVFSANSDEMLPAADQITKAVNHVIHKQNRGYKVINRWIKDAAINKNGIVKISWEELPEMWNEEFEAEDESVLKAKLVESPYEYEVIEKTKMTDTATITDEEAGESIEIKQDLMKFVVRFTRMKGMPIIENVPPEEFLMNEGATAINDSSQTRAVFHRKIVMVSDLLNDPRFSHVKEDEIMGGATSGYLEYEFEKTNRHNFDGTYDYSGTDPSKGLTRTVELVESFIKSDRDGDGIAEWRHCFSIGNTLLFDEEWFGDLPFASFCFFPIPHKFYGLSVYDKLQWYHRACSMLLRSEIDVRLLQNTYRIIANPKEIDMRDLQSGRPGIIKAKPGFESKDIQVLPTPNGAGNTTQILDYLHKEIVGQIKVDPNTGAISSDVEKSGNDADKTSQVVDNASAGIEAFAREFAETGLRDVIWQVTKLLIENSNHDSVVKLISKITPDTPELLVAQEDMIEAFDKDDLTAKVGLGHQTTAQKMRGAQAIIAQQVQLESSPVSPTPIPYKYKQMASMELAKSLGFEDAGKFFPNPEEVKAEQDKQLQLAQQQAQAQQQMASQQLQEDAKNNESKRILEDAKAQEAKVKAEGAARSQQLSEEKEVVAIENVKHDNELNVRRQESQEEQMAANIELQRANQELQRELAELKSRTDLEKQRMADEKTLNINKGGSE